MNFRKNVVYAAKVLPGATFRALARPVTGPVHLILAVADHFEPAIDPEDGLERVSRSEQERRLEWWREEYPKAADRWRDSDGRPFVHTYFYPTEQYLVAMPTLRCPPHPAIPRKPRKSIRYTSVLCRSKKELRIGEVSTWVWGKCRDYCLLLSKVPCLRP